MNIDNRESLANNLFQEVVNLIEQFTLSKDLSILKKASDTLSNIINYDDEHVGAYICTSYIFYVLENNQLALEYLEKAEKISPKIKESLSIFKSKISDSLKNNEKINENKLQYKSPKVRVSKESNFWNTMKKLF